MFDDSISNFVWQEIDDGGMEFGRSRKRPPFNAITFDDFGDLVGELLVNPAMIFGLELASFRYRIHVPATAAIAHRKPPRHIGDFVDHSAVRIRDVESLNQMQTRSAVGSFIDSIGFQTSAVGYDDK
jgi:hypothetical protein